VPADLGRPPLGQVAGDAVVVRGDTGVLVLARSAGAVRQVAGPLLTYPLTATADGVVTWSGDILDDGAPRKVDYFA
jgi:hypothetical protein